MTAEPRRQVGWPVWILSTLGLLAVPLDFILVMIVHGIGAYNNGGGGSYPPAYINAAYLAIPALGVALVAAMITRHRKLIIGLGSLLLAPALLAVVLVIGSSIGAVV